MQAGFLTLHALTMLMKIHSYLSTNGDLSHMAAELAAVRTKLDAAIETAGGYEKAIAVSTEEAVREGKPPLSPMPRATSLFAPSAEDAATLRQRKRSSKAGSGSSVDSRKLVVDDATRFHVLRTHPDHEIASLAARAHEVQEYLTSPGTRSVVWPANVTYANFVDYLLVPTLVYELEFPRTKAIRPLYVLEKVLATVRGANGTPTHCADGHVHVALHRQRALHLARHQRHEPTLRQHHGRPRRALPRQLLLAFLHQCVAYGAATLICSLRMHRAPVAL